MDKIDLDEGVTASTIDEVKVQTIQENKGVINRSMDYDTAMTSPTQLIAPETFPDSKDLNGNAMSPCDSKNDTVKFKRRHCGTVRCLVVALIVFIITAAVMTGLFSWRMISFKETKANKISTPCFRRENPVPFEKLPVKIQTFLERLGDEIKSTLENKLNGDIVMVNVVYYDKVIWQANYTTFKNSKVVLTDTNFTVFPVASLTKVFTSLLAFKLYNDEIISSLDDSITKYEPGFNIQNPFDHDNGEQITIRQLLSHESGLPREAPCYPDNKNNYCPHNHTYMLERLSKSKLLFSPGSDVLYGNLQFSLVGHALSKNYSGGYKKFVYDKVLAHFGMTSSYLHLNSTIKKMVYAPVYLFGVELSLRKWGWLDPSGGLLTTVDDLAKFEIAIFNNSENGFLKPAVLDEFFSPVYFFTDGKQMIGSPWIITFENGYTIFKQNGYVYGYQSEIFINPHLKLALNVFSTSHPVFMKFFNEKTIEKLTNLFHDELKELSDNKMKPKGVKNPKRYVGVYNTTEVPSLFKQHVRISTAKIVNGSHILTIKLAEFTFELTYIGDDVFEMIHKQCANFGLGVNRERIYFKGPTPQKIDNFIIYGIHLRGKATFYRS